jgi:hypothetical protein
MQECLTIIFEGEKKAVNVEKFIKGCLYFNAFVTSISFHRAIVGSHRYTF